MKVARVIPCLDVTDGRVVKGTNFVDLRDAGDPVELAARYGASAEEETSDPRQAYARFDRPARGRPPYWDRLPWAGR